MTHHTIFSPMLSKTSIRVLIGASFLGLPAGIMIGVSSASEEGEARTVVSLWGTVRDFRSDHTDFAVHDDIGEGHFAMNVSQMIGLYGRPDYVGGGRAIIEQWFDKDGNPIKPYGDAGLFGGHFDVDVFSSPTTKKDYHKHEFDDAYDITYLDIANNSELLFDEIVGRDYPNPLRIEMINTHNGGSGFYTFDAGEGEVVGLTSRGFDEVFYASDLVQFKINFVALNTMRGTDPRSSQNDIEDRDDAFALRLYDTVTGDFVYEISAYAHVGRHWDPSDWQAESPPAQSGDDSCGVALRDDTGVYGAPGAGLIYNSNSFKQWFQDVPGVNASIPYQIKLELNADGVYEFLTDSFYPVDGDAYGNEQSEHNHNFTYAIKTSFTYASCNDQFIEIETNDDAYVFIDGQLAIDIGGVGTSSLQYVALDRLGLEDGQEFVVHIFTAHRRESAESVFRLRTNVEFEMKEISIQNTLPYD